MTITDPKEDCSMFSSMSSALLWRGLLAIVIGVVSVAWPGITVGAFVILFAVYAFTGAAMEALFAFRSDKAGPVAGHVVLSLLSLAGGIVALLWPGITALVLTIWVAAWALATGVVEVALAFLRGESAGQRAAWALGGLVSIALGVVLAIRPDIGAVTLATVFGLFSIYYGVQALVMSANTRRVATAERRLSASTG
jgi:uncharacterized membrane protein HdeD (DUF308 family)